METKRTRFLEWLCPILFLLVFLSGEVFVQAQTIGKTIDKSNYQEYESLLIPALRRAVERGDFILPTGNLAFPYKQPDFFLAASRKNTGKFDVNEPGDLIDKSTGKIPNYNIYGFPFPNIDPKDPRAGDKIMWNFNFHKYRNMGAAYTFEMKWIAQGKGGIGVERYIFGRTYDLFFQGRPTGQEIKNPKGLLYAEMVTLLHPMSIRGTNMLTWEYQDDRESTVFAYVPAIRRNRQTSGVARSDPYMGSDGWMDTNQMWAGKNRTMKWKLVGERTILVPFHQLTKEIVEELPNGALQETFPKNLRWGFRTPGWKGASWADAATMTWVPRPVWVVEQMPKDSYYNWGLHVNYIDKDTYGSLLKEVYDRAGEFRTWIIGSNHYGEGPSGNNNIGHLTTYQSIDERIRHASISEGLVTPDFKVYLYLPESKLGADFYSVSNFLQMSK